MTLFPDTSVLLAAAGAPGGASREIFRRQVANGWVLVTTPYVVAEVMLNLSKLPPEAVAEWETLHSSLTLRDDVLTLDRIVVFGPPKDRPILFSAFAFADVLLTLDQTDFGPLMENPFYGLRIRRPGTFLAEERAAERLR